jgi:hypothetical protein
MYRGVYDPPPTALLTSVPVRGQALLVLVPLGADELLREQPDVRWSLACLKAPRGSGTALEAAAAPVVPGECSHTTIVGLRLLLNSGMALKRIAAHQVLATRLQAFFACSVALPEYDSRYGLPAVL